MWLSVEGLAKYLSISKETVYRMVYQKKVPHHRLGKLWRFHSEEIDAWVRGEHKIRKKGTLTSPASSDAPAYKPCNVDKFSPSRTPSPRRRVKKPSKSR